MQQTSPKTIIMPSNGAISPRRPFDWHAILLALAVSGTTGSFVFAWNTNSDIAVMKDQRIRDQKDISDMRQDLNKMSLSMQDLREMAIRNERINATIQQNQKP